MCSPVSLFEAQKGNLESASAFGWRHWEGLLFFLQQTHSEQTQLEINKWKIDVRCAIQTADRY